MWTRQDKRLDTNFPRTNGTPARPAGGEDKQKARIDTNDY